MYYIAYLKMCFCRLFVKPCNNPPQLSVAIKFISQFPVTITKLPYVTFRNQVMHFFHGGLPQFWGTILSYASDALAFEDFFVYFLIINGNTPIIVSRKHLSAPRGAGQ